MANVAHVPGSYKWVENNGDGSGATGRRKTSSKCAPTKLKRRWIADVCQPARKHAAAMCVSCGDMLPVDAIVRVLCDGRDGPIAPHWNKSDVDPN